MKSSKLPIEAVTVVAFEKRIFNRMPLTHKRKMKVWADKCEYGRLHTFIDEHGYDRWDELFRRRREGRFL
jgi:hypothetical protein